MKLDAGLETFRDQLVIRGRGGGAQGFECREKNLFCRSGWDPSTLNLILVRVKWGLVRCEKEGVITMFIVGVTLTYGAQH